MLDKARASVWIKVGAVVIVVAFILAYIPYANVSAVTDLFKSIFQSSGTQTQDAQTKARIITLKAAVKKNPKSVKDLTELGNLYYDEQEYQNAVNYYEQVIKLDPKKYDVMTDLGASYYALKQNDKALSILQQVTMEQPDQAMAWFNMGIVFQAKGDSANMRFAWERYLALKPTGQLADQVRSQLNQATTTTQ